MDQDKNKSSRIRRIYFLKNPQSEKGNKSRG